VRLMDEQGEPMEKLTAKLDPADVKTLFEFMRMSKGAEVSMHPQSVKLNLPLMDLMDLKLDGSATYLSWSCRIKSSLVGRNLDGFLTREEEPKHDTVGWNEWKTTHILPGFSTLRFRQVRSRWMAFRV
jgi:hypothetical protein